LLVDGDGKNQEEVKVMVERSLRVDLDFQRQKVLIASNQSAKETTNT
jgi:hypothetical protein